MVNDFEPPENSHDLGSGHWFTFIVGDAESYPTTDERLLDWNDTGDTLVGIIHGHPRPADRPGNGYARYCSGAVLFVRGRSEPDRPTWQVHSIEPLHIEPSVLCAPDKGGCGTHGWIRDGRWVPA